MMPFIQQDIADTFIVDQDITFKIVNDFQYKMEKFILQSRKYMILDLSKVKYINNSALGIIAHTALKAKQYKKELVIVGNNPHLNEIFDIVKFNVFTKLFPTCEEALEYYQRLERGDEMDINFMRY